MRDKQGVKTSVIVTTYEWPRALEAVLRSVLYQGSDDFEILVADDGSGPETAAVIRRFAAIAPVPIIHVWQEDEGFRAARVRNLAAAHAWGKYLVFIDGDTVMGQGFIADHLALAEPGYFVAGSRIHLPPDLTRELLDSLPDMPIINRRLMWRWWLARRVRRIHPAVKVNLPALRYFRPRRWQAVFGCNLGVHKADFIRVNGFDNEFVGWGHEDSEFAARCANAGVRRKEGKLYSYIAHLKHDKRSRDARWVNYERLQETIRAGRTFAQDGYREVVAALGETGPRARPDPQAATERLP